MIPESSITYIGPPELQNAHIVGFHRRGDRATVRIRGADGHHVSFEFAGGTPRYRAGLEFMNADTAAVQRIIDARSKRR